MRAFAAAVLLCLTASWAFAAECSREWVDLRGDWGQVRFTVEIADTPKTRERGLMFRESMDANSGMLFIYGAPRSPVFWMKNTLIPLDMIFVDRTGTVTRVHHEAIPGDETPIPGGDGVIAVLEVNGGLAARYGIDKGSQMRHPVFSGGPAAWPC